MSDFLCRDEYGRLPRRFHESESSGSRSEYPFHNGELYPLSFSDMFPIFFHVRPPCCLLIPEKNKPRNRKMQFIFQEKIEF